MHGERVAFTGQKIALAIEIEPHFAEEAKKRQQEQAKRNQPQSLKVENVPPLEKAKSRDQAAATVGISGKLVSRTRPTGNGARRQRNSTQQAIREQVKLW